MWIFPKVTHSFQLSEFFFIIKNLAIKQQLGVGRGCMMTHHFKLCHLCSCTLCFCDEQQMWQTHIDFWLFFPCCERIFLQKAMFLYHCGQKWQNRIINGKCVSLVKNFIKFSAIFHNITSCWSVYSQTATAAFLNYKCNRKRQFVKNAFSFRNVKDNSAHFQFMLQDGSDAFVHFYPVFRFRKFLLLVRMGF